MSVAEDIYNGEICQYCHGETEDGAIQIPIKGDHFKGMNLCVILKMGLVCLNFHPIEENSIDDQQYFLSLDDAKHLRDDIIDAIDLIEEEETKQRINILMEENPELLEHSR